MLVGKLINKFVAELAFFDFGVGNIRINIVVDRICQMNNRVDLVACYNSLYSVLVGYIALNKGIICIGADIIVLTAVYAENSMFFCSRLDVRYIPIMPLAPVIRTDAITSHSFPKKQHIIYIHYNTYFKYCKWF